MQMQQKHCTKSTIPWLILPQEKVDPVKDTRSLPSHRVHCIFSHIPVKRNSAYCINNNNVLLIVWWFKMNNPKHWSTSSIDIQTQLLDNLDQTCCVDETGPQCVWPGCWTRDSRFTKTHHGPFAHPPNQLPKCTMYDMIVYLYTYRQM